MITISFLDTLDRFRRHKEPPSSTTRRRLAFEEANSRYRRNVTDEELVHYSTYLAKEIKRKLSNAPEGKNKHLLITTSKIFEYLRRKLDVRNPALEILRAALYMESCVIHVGLDEDRVASLALEENNTYLEETFQVLDEKLFANIEGIKLVVQSCTREVIPLCLKECFELGKPKFEHFCDSSIMLPEDIKTGIQDINDVFQNFIKGQYSLSDSSFAEIMQDLSTKLNDNLDENKLCACLVSSQGLCSNHSIAEMVVFFMVIKSKYLYLSTALNIFKKDFEGAIGGFNGFNNELISVIARLGRVAHDLKIECASM